jgi:hypothetical protein
VDHNDLYSTVTKTDLWGIPERALLSMAVLAEAGIKGDVTDLVHAMWIMRTRVEFDLTGAGASYRSQLLNTWAIEAFWIVTRPGYENWGWRNFNDSVDPNGAADGGRFARLYQGAWSKASFVMNAPYYENMPVKLRRLDSWSTSSRPQGHEGHKIRDLDVHYFWDAYPGDNPHWDDYESRQTHREPEGWN